MGRSPLVELLDMDTDTPVMPENTKCVMRNTRPKLTRFHWSPTLLRSLAPSPTLPLRVCVTKAIEITEVKCEDKIDNVCFNVAKFVDAENVVDQVETIIGEPSCEQLTLTLPTQACSKAHHAPAPYHG